MKKALIISMITGSAVLLGGVVAVAQDRGPGGPPPHKERMAKLLEDVDLNGNGAIEKSEAEAKKATTFSDMDLNSDGVVTADDVIAYREAKRLEKQKEMILARLDTDKDGVISQAEFINGPDPMFDRADRNGDGIVDQTELESAKGKMRDRMKKFREDRGGRR